MNPAKQLYRFLTACGGSWRNSLFISSREGTDHAGYLMAVDRDGQPIVLTVRQFQQASGEQIDPAECCGKLTEAGFGTLYAQYLLWRCPSAEERPLRRLSQETPMQIG